MNCKDAADLMPAFVDDELTETQAAEFRVHAAECAKCRDMAKVVAAFTASLDAQIKGYGRKIKPPPGAQDELLLKLGSMAGEPNNTRRLWIAVAAMFLGAFCMYAWYTISPTSNDSSDEKKHLAAKVLALERARAAQQDLAAAFNDITDPEIALTTCAYLPPAQARDLLAQRLGREPTESILASAWPEQPAELLMRFSRNASEGDETSELLFEQWTDGRVHVEHRVTSGDRRVETIVDAPDFERLTRENPSLHPELALTGILPLPSRSNVRRDVISALLNGEFPGDAALRLLTLRLSRRFDDPKALFEAAHGMPLLCGTGGMNAAEEKARSSTLEQLRAEAQRLEQETGIRGESWKRFNELSQPLYRLSRS